jgi:hypothetical protein
VSLDAKDACQADHYQREYPQALPAIGLGRDTDEAAEATAPAAPTATTTG